MSEVLALLKELIARPSVSPFDAGCQEIIAERLSRAGFVVESLRFGETDNLWARMGTGPVRLCFNGHTDVVPPGPIEEWSSDPFTPTERDGYLYGRGASDMKSGVAAMVVALERLAASGEADGLALLLTSDEEAKADDGTVRALRFLLERGEVIQSALVAEPTSVSVLGDTCKPGRRGSLTGRITVQGVQGHVAYAHLAENAAHVLAPALSELVSERWDEGDDFFPPTSMQVWELRSGAGASNVIPGEAFLGLNFRNGPASPAEVLIQRTEAIFAKHGVRFDAVWKASAVPFLSPPGALAEKVASAIRSVTGIETNLSTGGGTSDARHFVAEGIETLEFGLVPVAMHGIDERVLISDLEKLAEIIVETAL